MALPDATALAEHFAPAEPYQRLYGVMSHEGLLAKPSDLYQRVAACLNCKCVPAIAARFV